MNGLTTVTTKGQVTIPERVRLELGIKVGDKIYFDRVLADEGTAMVRVMPRDVVRKLAGSLKSKIKMIDLGLAREKIAKDMAAHYGLK
jgi:AbrB family looped-hinge helix DNA binding protein